MLKKFKDLTEKEILALAISLEEEDGRIYGEFADRLKENFPSTASALEAMREEESGHRHRLIELFQERFGDNIPLIRRQDVKGFVHRPAIWLNPTVSPQRIRNQVQTRTAIKKVSHHLLLRLKNSSRSSLAGRALLGQHL